MESIDKLRMLAYECYTFNDCSDKLMEIADEIEREIAERERKVLADLNKFYMKLPLDADGVPIRLGDTVECEPSGVFRVSYVGASAAVADEGPLVVINDTSRVCRHVKPRTVEDVLRECCNEWNEHCGDEWESGVYAKYADELRQMGVAE